ncbi:MAG: T9SS type A sorting domain-containing protein [Candidatus Aegiribacteria sp.]
MMDSYYGDGYDMVHQHGHTLWSCGYRYESPDYKGVVSVSHDAGTTWTRHELYSGSDYGYIRAVAVDPSDPDRVFCLGYQSGGYILHHTSSGGGAWSSTVPSGYTGTPYGLAVCPDNGDILAAASSSGLYASTDGGGSWTRVSYDFGGANDLLESDLFDGLLIATADQGVWLWENWTGSPVQVGGDLGFADVACLTETEDYLFAGTDGAAAWRSYNGTGVGGGEPSSPPGITLSAAPNPAAGFTVLSFCLPDGRDIGLALYDITGRRVMTAAEGMMAGGTHSVTLDTSVLTPGMYFARLTADGEAVTARMVVAR